MDAMRDSRTRQTSSTDSAIRRDLRVDDLAEALLVGAGHGHVTESAAARLWACAAGLDRREFAVCAGSVGLTMAESFLRHGRIGEAAGAVPEMVRALNRALSLAGA
jgi:hypothetical protein